MSRLKYHDSGKGPFVRRRDLQQQPTTVTRKSPAAHDEFAVALVKNETGQQLHVFDCVRLADALVDPTTGEDHERAYYSRMQFRGELVDEDGISNVAIMQQPAEDERGAPALFTGITVARLTGDTGKSRATTVNGEVTLEAADDGPFEVLHDPGPEGEERFAYVRFGGKGCQSLLVKPMQSKTAPCITRCAVYTGALGSETVNGETIVALSRHIDTHDDTFWEAKPLCDRKGAEAGGGTSSVSVDSENPSGIIGPAEYEIAPWGCASS